jgi:hypothetical protein
LSIYDSVWSLALWLALLVFGTGCVVTKRERVGYLAFLAAVLLAIGHVIAGLTQGDTASRGIAALMGGVEVALTLFALLGAMFVKSRMDWSSRA